MKHTDLDIMEKSSSSQNCDGIAESRIMDYLYIFSIIGADRQPSYGEKAVLPQGAGNAMVTVCMLTEIERYRNFIPIKNPGGMGTNVPMVIDELEKLGCRVIMDQLKSDYDILHVHNPLPTSLASAIKAKIRGIPVIMHGRHLPELVKGGFPGGGLIFPLMRKYSVMFYNMGDVVVGATPYVARTLSGDGVKRPFRIIPNGINREIFRKDAVKGDEFRERLGIDKSDKLVVSVGLRIPRKGVDTFVNMASKLQHRKDVKFIWAGASESILEDALNEISPGNVIFPGHVPFDEIVGVYSAADVFTFPTRGESYGNVMLEAASCGCPLLIRDIPVYEDWVIDNEHCLKANTDEEFVSKLERMLDDAALKSKLTDGAKALAKEHDIKKTALMLMELYETVLSGGVVN